MSRLVAQCEPTTLHYSAVISDKGYDEYGAGVMHFPNKVVAYFGTGVHANLRNDATIYGSEGKIHIPNPWKCSEGGMTLQRNGKPVEHLEFKSNNDELYALEADTVAEFVDGTECPYMTWLDTIDNMRALDALRKSAGLKFAAEMTE
jgi:predicted dehydrogenase